MSDKNWLIINSILQDEEHTILLRASDAPVWDLRIAGPPMARYEIDTVKRWLEQGGLEALRDIITTKES